MADIILPDTAIAGNSGHVDAHNKIRTALDELNRAKAEKSELAKVSDAATSAKARADEAWSKADQASQAAKGALSKAVADTLYRPLSEIPTKYTPGLVGSDWSIGTGKTYGEYAIEGAMCHLRIKIAFGAGSKFPKDPGTGLPPPFQITLPPGITPAPGDLGIMNGHADVIMKDVSETKPLRQLYFGMAYITDGNPVINIASVGPDAHGMAVDPLDSETPFPWAPNDSLEIPNITFIISK